MIFSFALVITFLYLSGKPCIEHTYMVSLLKNPYDSTHYKHHQPSSTIIYDFICDPEFFLSWRSSPFCHFVFHHTLISPLPSHQPAVISAFAVLSLVLLRAIEDSPRGELTWPASESFLPELHHHRKMGCLAFSYEPQNHMLTRILNNITSLNIFSSTLLLTVDRLLAEEICTLWYKYP